MSDVTLLIYVTSSCSTCAMAKRRLDSLGIEYNTVNVEEDPEAAERLKRNGLTQAPVFSFSGSLHTIADLPTIIKTIQAKEAAA